MGKKLACPADAALDLVENEQETVLVAQAPQCLHEILLHQPQAALALDRLDQDGRRGVGDRGLQGVEIAEGNLIETGHFRAEAFEIFRLPAGRDRGQRAAVEGAFEGYRMEPLRMALRILITDRKSVV